MVVAGYILRIASEEWVNQVFSILMYFTNINRKWESGQTILFVHKTSKGDAIIGYGVIEAICNRNEISEEEKGGMIGHSWKKALKFKYVVRLEESLLIKKTFLRESSLRGRYLHGLPISEEQLDSIVNRNAWPRR
jgi:hypothetical protein